MPFPNKNVPLIKPLVAYWISYYDYDENLLTQEKIWVEKDKDAKKQLRQAKKLALKRFQKCPVLYYEAVLSSEEEPDFFDDKSVLAVWDRESLSPTKKIEVKLDAESIIAGL